MSKLPLGLRQPMIQFGQEQISITRQAELLNISRSFLYSQSKSSESDEKLMAEIDRIYLEYPFYGARRILKELEDRGYSNISRYQVREMMKLMGIDVIYQKPKTSIPNKEHEVYPYLLKGKEITKVNQVRSTDITYIKLKTGWIYLGAVIDWYSRKIISWKLSNTMDGAFCRETLKEALEYGKPEIFNTDQGSQYTSKKFTSILINNGIQVSMDGVNRCLDNVYIERFWRSIKYENIFIHKYETMKEAYEGISKYIDFYNTKRKHQSINYQTPEFVWQEGCKSM